MALVVEMLGPHEEDAVDFIAANGHRQNYRAGTDACEPEREGKDVIVASEGSGLPPEQDSFGPGIAVPSGWA